VSNRVNHGYWTPRDREEILISTLTTQFRDLLKQFDERCKKSESSEPAGDERQQFETLLNGYDEAVEHYRRQQEQVADGFNLMDVLGLTNNEIRHTMVLAWLLDHDIQKLGTHAQGNLGFRLFLQEFDLPLEYAEHKFWVSREAIGNESIVDIEIAYRGEFLIHIENKIWSKEGPDQTTREWSDLQRKAVEFNVKSAHVHALFLTPNRKKPSNGNFTPIGWGSIVNVLEKFAEQAKPRDVRLFASHYARGLRRFILIQGNSEDNDAETTLK
jgi:hypothetical protein